MFRRRPAREARDGEVEPAPKKVDRARLADEAPPELLADRVGPQQNTPESMRVRGIVRRVPAIVLKADRVEIAAGMFFREIKVQTRML